MCFPRKLNGFSVPISGDVSSHLRNKTIRMACFLDIRQGHFYITAAKNSEYILVMLMSVANLL
jgi:hypothetical protein